MIAENRTYDVIPEMIRDVALRLFAERGFANTSLVQIAEAAEVDHELLRRYFSTKAEMIWYGYDETYDILVATLREHRGIGRVGDAIRAALGGVLGYRAAENDDVAAHIEIVDRDPVLFTESEDRIAGHKQAIIAFVADEIGQGRDDLTPQLVGETVCVAAAITTRHWSSVGDARVSLCDAVDAAVAPILEGFAGVLKRAPEGPATDGR